MKIRELFDQKTVFSFEVFPPKKTSSIDTVYKTLEELEGLTPDFISVTFSAGGSGNSALALDIASQIKNSNAVEPMIHLPCINYSKEEISGVLSELDARGIENILALRGDINPDIPPKNEFRYASELVAFIKERGDYDIAGACYPEGHPECESRMKDIDNLKRKVDAGVDFLTTQMFFDNNLLYNFLYKIREAGITVPVVPGIMPITAGNQVARAIQLSGSFMPQRFKSLVDKFGHPPDAMKQAGIAYATDQIIDLFANGILNVHVYSMNKPDVAEAIMKNISSIIG